VAKVKTAISLEKPVLEEVNSLAKKLNISRSRLFALAVQEFIQRYKNKELLKSINKAYKDVPETEDRLVSRMRHHHFKIVKDQW